MNNQVKVIEKTIADNVLNRVNVLTEQGRLHLPANYSVGNALNSAWLIILQTKDKTGKAALDVCTNASIANALLDMVIMALNPVKKQGYFIVYGDKLAWFTSYFGKCAALKRLNGIDQEPIGTVIYEGDDVEISHNEFGEEVIVKHTTSWANKLKGNIVGAYATVKCNGYARSCVMSMKEIKEAWSKSLTAEGKEHNMFTGEFAKRTVINRVSKMIINTSNDDDLLAETLSKNEDQHYDFIDVNSEEEARQAIAEKANQGEIVDIPNEVSVEPINDVVQEPIQEPTVKNRGF